MFAIKVSNDMCKVNTLETLSKGYLFLLLVSLVYLIKYQGLLV